MLRDMFDRFLRNRNSDLWNSFYIVVVFIIFKLHILCAGIVHGEKEKFQDKSQNKPQCRTHDQDRIRYIQIQQHIACRPGNHTRCCPGS